jgi:hypothetical protein
LGLGLIAVLILLVTGVGLVAGSGGGGSSQGGGNSDGGGSNSKEQQGAAGDQYASEIDPFTKANYGILAANPDEHAGAEVDVIGQLLDNPENRGDEVAFQMWTDPANADWSTVVHTDEGSLGLRTNNYVHVRGEVLGSMKGENAFGVTVSAVEVDADTVERVEGVDAIDPTQKTLTVSKTVENEGFSITLEKIEFGTKHARAYISARNEGEKSAKIDFDRSKITQSGERFGNRDPYDYHLDKPKGGMPTGAETEGWVIFGSPDRSKPFQVVFAWERGGFMAKKLSPRVFKVTP